MNNEKRIIKDGEEFEHQGTKYRCLESFEYKESNSKQPIYPPDAKGPITIKTAKELGLIKEKDLFDYANNSAQTVAENSAVTYETTETNTNPAPSTAANLPSEFSKPSPVTPDESHCESGIFYLSVDYIRVQGYLAQGLIYPSVLEGPRGDEYDDVQSLAKIHLHFTRHPLELSPRELTLAVFLTTDEIQDALSGKNDLFLNRPLPISRVRTIYVPRGEDSLDIYLDGWILPDVAVPRHLFRFLDEAENVQPGLEIKQAIQPPDGGDIAESANGRTCFDRMLGAMAYMRNVSCYYSEQEEVYQSFPNFYANISRWLLANGDRPDSNLIAAIFDENLRNELTETERAVFELLHRKGNAEKEEIKQIARDQCTRNKGDELLREAYTLALGEMDDYMGALELLNANDCELITWIIVVLFHYRMKNSNDYRNIKQKIADNWKNPRIAAKIMAFLGAYYGYAKLDAKEYTTYSWHPEIAKAVERRPNIKYHLESLHERVLIETVYRRAFNLDNTIPEELWRFFEQQADNDYTAASKPSPTRYLKHEKVDDCPYLDGYRLRVKAAHDFINTSSPDADRILKLFESLADTDINALLGFIKRLYEDDESEFMEKCDEALAKLTDKQG